MIRERSTLIFDHTPTPEQLEENYREAQKTLTQICRETRRDIRPEVPHLFSELVRQMKLMDSRTLGSMAQLASRGEPCSMAEKFIRDAVPILGTAASVAMIKDQIRDMMARPEQEIDFDLIDFWVTHMAFYPTITSQMLQEAKVLPYYSTYTWSNICLCPNAYSHRLLMSLLYSVFLKANAAASVSQKQRCPGRVDYGPLLLPSESYLRQ